MRLAAILAALLLASCGSDAQTPLELRGSTMGTQFTVKITRHSEALDEARLRPQLDALLQGVNQMMSTYLRDSEISRFNSSQGVDWQSVSIEFCNSVVESLELSELTDGGFDITAAPLVNLWGFGPEEIGFEPPTDAAIADVMTYVGYDKLRADCSQPAVRRLAEGLMLDMSAYGKGYAVDRLADWLGAMGVEDYLVEIGGELRVAGHNAAHQPWAIGIEVPRAGVREPYTVVHVSDTAIATSGDYRNFFEYEGVRYSHEIDVRTGRPVTHQLAAVSIIDTQAARADALATGLLVMGPQAGMELAIRENIAAMFLTRTNSGIEERVSPRFEEFRQRL
ncbi:MAG: FAD:protein FMN transferase [Woeseiaceae bacterium]